MAVKVILKVVISGIGFFFYLGIDVIMPGVNGNAFLSRNVLAKQSNV